MLSGATSVCRHLAACSADQDQEARLADLAACSADQDQGARLADQAAPRDRWLARGQVVDPRLVSLVMERREEPEEI